MGRVWVMEAFFTDGDGTSLVTKYGVVNISPSYADLEIKSNGFRSDTASTRALESFEPTSTPDNLRGQMHPEHQYAQVVAKSPTTSGQIGVILRVKHTSTYEGYLVYTNGPNAALIIVIRLDDESWTYLGSASQSVSADDTIRGEADGDSITGFHNGTQKVSVTDSTYPSNDGVGIVSGQNPSGASGDDFEAGHLYLLPHTWAPKSNNRKHGNNHLRNRQNRPGPKHRRRFHRITAGG